jgi:hypothetical protein
VEDNSGENEMTLQRAFAQSMKSYCTLRVVSGTFAAFLCFSYIQYLHIELYSHV